MNKEKQSKIPQMPLGQHMKMQLVAWQLGKSTKWVKSKIEDGTFEGYLLGHDLVVDLHSVRVHLDQCRVTGKKTAEVETDEEGEE